LITRKGSENNSPSEVNTPFINADSPSGVHTTVAMNMEKPNAPQPQNWSAQNGVSLCLNFSNIVAHSQQSSALRYVGRFV
jgi:hypothetical protein